MLSHFHTSDKTAIGYLGLFHFAHNVYFLGGSEGTEIFHPNKVSDVYFRVLANWNAILCVEVFVYIINGLGVDYYDGVAEVVRCINFNVH